MNERHLHTIHQLNKYRFENFDVHFDENLNRLEYILCLPVFERWKYFEFWMTSKFSRLCKSILIDVCICSMNFHLNASQLWQPIMTIQMQSNAIEINGIWKILRRFLQLFHLEIKLVLIPNSTPNLLFLFRWIIIEQYRLLIRAIFEDLIANFSQSLSPN